MSHPAPHPGPSARATRRALPGGRRPISSSGPAVGPGIGVPVSVWPATPPPGPGPGPGPEAAHAITAFSRPGELVAHSRRRDRGAPRRSRCSGGCAGSSRAARPARPGGAASARLRPGPRPGRRARGGIRAWLEPRSCCWRPACLERGRPGPSPGAAMPRRRRAGTRRASGRRGWRRPAGDHRQHPPARRACGDDPALASSPPPAPPGLIMHPAHRRPARRHRPAASLVPRPPQGAGLALRLPALRSPAAAPASTATGSRSPRPGPPASSAGLKGFQPETRVRVHRSPSRILGFRRSGHGDLPGDSHREPRPRLSPGVSSRWALAACV